MNKAEFISELAKKLGGVTNKEAAHSLETVLDCMLEGLVKHKKVSFVGFGNFDAKLMKERKVRNPQTGKEMIVPAKYRITFRAGNTLKQSINGKGSK